VTKKFIFVAGASCSGQYDTNPIKGIDIVRNHAKLPAIAILAAALCVQGSALAGSANLGLQLSASSNKFTGDLPQEGSWEGASGFGADLLLEWNFADDITLSFQPGLTPRNGRQDFKENDVVVASVDYNFDYLNLPLLIRVTTKPDGTRGFVTAGLEVGFLLSATYDDGTGSYDMEDELKPTVFGAMFGAGALVPVGGNLLIFELRYDQGLEDIVDNGNEDSDAGLTSSSIKYRGLQLKAGFILTLGGE